MLLIVIGAQFFCGMASVTANSRMIYAFSRDGAVPGHKWWHSINKRTRTPTNAIWLAAVLAWLLVAPAYWFGSIVAYYAVTAIGVIGLYIAYVIPTFLRLRAKEAFKPGPVDARAKGRLIGWIAVVWVIFVCIILCLPQFNWGDLDAIRRPPSSSSTCSTSRRSSVGRAVRGHRAVVGRCPLVSGSQARRCRGRPRSSPRSRRSWKASRTEASSRGAVLPGRASRVS